MLDLISIEEIKPIKDDIRCHTCLRFNVILHASDVWIIKDNNFVRLPMPEVGNCYLIDKIFKGSLLREEDYEVINACELYEDCREWIGVNKTFIAIINSLVEYLIFVEDKRFDRESIFNIAKQLPEKNAVIIPSEREINNKDMRKQFLVELNNYELMEAVRRIIRDT